MNMFDRSVITVYQGNALMIEITLTDTETGDPVPVENDDYVLFTVVNQRGMTVIQKRLTRDDYDTSTNVLTCKIDPSDTMNLPTGEYYYDCLYVCGQDTPSTFVSSTFIIVKSYGKLTTGPPDTQGGDDNG